MSEYPRITYQTSGRTFDRLFKEQSLDETKDVVRRKLGLGLDAPIELVQLRDGRRIDLEDDDDFEAFKALTKTSLHATVAASFPQNGRSSSSRAGKNTFGEEDRRPNGRLSGPDMLETVQSDMAASAVESFLVQIPSAHVSDTPRPPKRRRVSFLGDLATSSASPPPLQSALKEVGPTCPREVRPTSLHNSTPEAVALPSFKPTKARSSAQDQREKPKKHKRKVVDITVAEDGPPADLSEEPVNASHKKRKKNKTPSRKEPSPTPGDSNPGDVDLSSDTRKKHSRKGQTTAPEIPAEDSPIPTGIRTGNGERLRIRPASPVAGDVLLQSGMDAPNLDTPKQAKTGKRKSGSADAGSSVTKSKTGLVDQAEGGMPEPTKSLKKSASKKQVESEVSKTSNNDDIDKTIAAFLTRRQKTHSSNLWELAATGELGVSVDDPTPKTNKKSKEVKSGARSDGTTYAGAQVPPASSVAGMETNATKRSIVRKANQKTAKSNRPLTLYDPVGLNMPTVTVAVDEESASSRDSTFERGCSSAEPSGSESGSKLGTTQRGSCPTYPGKSVHLLAECPIVQKRPYLNDVRIAQVEKDPGFAPSSEAVVPRHRFTEKSRSTRSDSSSDSSDTESSQISVPATTPVALTKGVSIAEAKPTIPKGLDISEVLVEHDEGSSSDNSTEGENEENAFAGVQTSLNDPSGPVDLEDKLTALINGPVKSGPRKSILDEIPSSSGAGSESSSEDLILDEEEDLSKQPSHKLTRAQSKIRSSSIEPEDTSEDEEDVSAPVYMDTSHGVPDHSQKLLAVGGGSENHVAINAEAEASKRPEVDTYLAQPLEVQNQDHTTSPQTVLSRVDATTPPPQSCTKLPRPAPPEPESDAIVIDTVPSSSTALVSTEPQTNRVLVPASSPVIDGGATKANEKVQSQDMDDDVESAVEPHSGGEESDPIEQEDTQPPVDRPAPSKGISSVPRGSHRRASRIASNLPVSEQPSRRSNRLANRRSSVAASEATLVPLTQIRSKMTSALENSMSSTKDKEWIRNVSEEATRGKFVRNPVGKSRDQSARSTAQHSGDSGDDTSPSVAREDGSPRAPMSSSQVKWTTLPPPDQSQPYASSVIDELQMSSSQGPLGTTLPLGEDESSRSDDKKNAPVPSRRDMVSSRGGGSDVQPLFFPGSSQVPRAPSASPSGSENESETAAPLLPRKTPTRSTPGPASQFRRLSDMASSDVLFSKSKATRRRVKNTPSLKVQSRLDASDDGEDDEESSSSSEDAAANSHIPKERRAGAGRQRKEQGLSSLFSSRS